MACALLNQLSEIKKKYGIEKLVVLLQYRERTRAYQLELMQRIKRCVDASVITIVDTFPELKAINDKGPDQFARLYRRGHMTGEGNNLVAELIAESLSSSTK